jgi:SAM-dependent methyltransferase
MQRSLILDQFSKQAGPFATIFGSPSHESALELIARTVDLQAHDTVLDVACGPGIVACYLAKRSQHVIGVDVTPAMLEQARKLQTHKELSNVQWTQAGVYVLPSQDGTFSLVLSRYAFHHFLRPQAVLEIYNVFVPKGGLVAVIDVAPAKDKLRAYDEAESLRDPSHVHELSVEDFVELGSSQPGLQLKNFSQYNVQMALDEALANSFPVP